MRWIRFAVLVLLTSVLQVALSGLLSIGRPDIRPDLLLILLIFFGSRCSATDTVITSFAIGFIADLVNPIGNIMGPRIISFGLFGTLLFNLQRIFSLRRPIYQGAAIFVVGALAAVLSYALASLRTDTSSVSLSAQAVWQPLYSSILGPLFSLPAGWWMHMNKKARWSPSRGVRSSR